MNDGSKEDLQQKIERARAELADLEQTQAALAGLEGWNENTTMGDIIRYLVLLKSLATMPALVIFRDGGVHLIRHDAVRAETPLKSLLIERSK